MVSNFQIKSNKFLAYWTRNKASGSRLKSAALDYSRHITDMDAITSVQPKEHPYFIFRKRERRSRSKCTDSNKKANCWPDYLRERQSYIVSYSEMKSQTKNELNKGYTARRSSSTNPFQHRTTQPQKIRKQIVFHDFREEHDVNQI